MQRPTSAKVGNTALVLGDGTIEGFVGGDCAEESVRTYALKAIESAEPMLLRIVPFGGEEERGVVTVQNPCLSGGMIEVFLEPVVGAPRVFVEGEMPISEALKRLGAQVGLDMVGVTGGDFEPGPRDLALVVAGHGREELPALRTGLEAGLPYVGPRGQPAPRPGRDRRAAQRRRPGRAARAHRHAGRAGHRRPHAGGDRRLDPRPDHRGAPRPRAPSPRSTRSAG